MRAVFAAALLLSAGCASSAVTGSGRAVTVRPVTASFDRIDVGSTFEVLVKQGDSDEVVIRVDDNLRDKLDLDTRGTLRLALKPDVDLADATLTAEVTVRTLRSIRVSGASKVRFGGDVQADELELRLSGASRMEQGRLLSRTIALHLSGASSVTLKGSAERLTVAATGASQAGLKELEAQDAGVRLSGASSASVLAQKSLAVVASGGSKVIHRGGAEPGRRQTDAGSTIVRGEG